MLRIVEPPRRCPYLPAELASHELNFGVPLTPELYSDLLSRGYRRIADQLYRPACRSCHACISLRVLAAEHALTASERRVLRQNATIRRVLVPATVTRQHVDLFNRYQAFMHKERGWELSSHSLTSYRRSFVDGPKNIAWEWNYFDNGRLVGVALMDIASDAVSLVYFYYAPDWRPKSPGRFSILNQILFAKERGIRYVYLGYWVSACPSLNYKSRFFPHEVLDAYENSKEPPTWRRVSGS